MPTDFVFKPHTCNRRITVKEFHGRPIIEELEWLDMRAYIVIKWEWYFRYRAALLQVKYPRYLVEIEMWNTKPSEFTQKQLDEQRRKRNITTAKRMITKVSNRLKEYEEEENKKLIPDFENEYYIKAKEKLEKYKQQLKNLENGGR